ncbi:hypothetical protein [Streptomyces sp. Je 1-369]|nr:hypothetical protein [Streptomyces sp. Je 1-369]WAL93106.1 hypothetical protein NOO62_00485 [Streptomyces sp. Je 1-369]WAL99874.1 hypothetical protein NOO62_38640 [Streptomyces sp. Je 1-369]
MSAFIPWWPGSGVGAAAISSGAPRARRRPQNAGAGTAGSVPRCRR